MSGTDNVYSLRPVLTWCTSSAMRCLVLSRAVLLLGIHAYRRPHRRVPGMSAAYERYSNSNTQYQAS
eukprot:2331395-Rhodomonas_salina.2